MLEAAASKSDDGELYCRLGSVYLDNDQFRKAADANKRGLAKGGVKRPDQCQLVKGMAHFNLKEYSAARKAFKAAARDKRSVKYADQWIKYMDNEIDRQKKLEEGINVALN